MQHGNCNHSLPALYRAIRRMGAESPANSLHFQCLSSTIHSTSPFLFFAHFRAG